MGVEGAETVVVEGRGLGWSSGLLKIVRRCDLASCSGNAETDRAIVVVVVVAVWKKKKKRERSQKCFRAKYSKTGIGQQHSHAKLVKRHLSNSEILGKPRNSAREIYCRDYRLSSFINLTHPPDSSELSFRRQ